MDQETVEDILNDSLTFFGEEEHDREDQHCFSYGPLTLTTARKANTLLADHIFSPSLLLAERIERNIFPVKGRTMIELGAGAAVPSFVASILPEPPSLVVVTDYPDAGILGNLEQNLERNRGSINSDCKVYCDGYEWGQDAGLLLRRVSEHTPASAAGYDIVVLSDLLHFDRAHSVLVASLTALLAKNTSSCTYVGAGIYTRPEHCTHFLRLSEAAGIVWVDGGSGVGDDVGREEDTVWRGTMAVKGIDVASLGVRKGMCRWWIGKWAETHLPATADGQL
ncbi:hypothetical protein EVG20_g5609 [Dentipellis fragilis]|uniref:Nicotinamide N-methyltransferase n=1 Tax=Dentipellis fragilis TaxID=205917 RepID=A0A4Y9YSH3_9AGAM|nr:hypothetical protein EVG20_g5609 [Dentipellis fragilis]